MKKTIISAAVLAACAFTSCNQENAITGTYSKACLSIDASLAQPVSRAPKSAFEAGDQLGLFICNENINTPYTDTKPNTPFTFNGTVWESQVIYLDTNPATIWAYYPYKTTNISGSAIPVEIASQTDYLHGQGKNKASHENRNVDIAMKHALCQFVLKMKTADYDEGDARLTRIALENGNSRSVLYTDGTLDLTTGKVTGTKSANLTYAQDIKLSDGGTTFSTIVMPVAPTEAEGDIKLVVTIDGHDFYFLLKKDTEWKPGYRNIYSFTVTNTGITIGGEDGTGVTVEPWQDSTETDIDLIPVL